MRWGVEKRLEFIEFRLFWEGRINRADIVEQFGVSVLQASKDLTLYEEKAPGNLIYDKSAKRYKTADNFNPVFMHPNASTYFAHVRETNGRTSGLTETWLASAPQHDTLPIPNRHVTAHVLRDVLIAVRESHFIEVLYQSMSTRKPTPEWRRISPHAFGNDGVRWHIRAFCHIDHKFKDLILSRCMKTRNHGFSTASANDDKLWHDRFAVMLVPNPALSESQRSIIAQDYKMMNGHTKVIVRKALLYYFLKRLRLDISDKLDNPHEVPIVVVNRAAFEATLAEAMS